MQHSSPLHFIGYLFGATMIVLGGLLLAGILVPSGSIVGGSEMARTIFGIVLILFGVFRIASAWTRSQGRSERRDGRSGIGL